MSNQLNELKKLPTLSLRFSLICVVEKNDGIGIPIENSKLVYNRTILKASQKTQVPDDYKTECLISHLITRPTRNAYINNVKEEGLN
jgi:hypothetical protein